MRTFGAFSAKGGKPFYGELIGDEVNVLKGPFWLGIEPTGEKSAEAISKSGFRFRHRS